MTHSFSVPWPAIQTILQLKSDDVYTPIMSPEGVRGLVNYSHTLLSFAGSPAQDLFKDRDNLDGIECAVLSKNNAFAVSIRHPEVSSDGTPEDWQTFLIGNVVDLGEDLPEESRYKMEPIFVLSGQIINNGEDFLIRDMICRLPTTPSDEMVNWAIAKNQNDIKAMLVYGHQAVTDIKNDAPLDLEALESTLNTPRYNVDEEFQDICQPATPSLSYLGICRAFQINNEGYYTRDLLEPGSDKLDSLNEVFKALNMPTAEYLGDSSSISVQEVIAYTHANDRDQCVTILEYVSSRNDGGTTHHFCVIMYKNVLNKKNNMSECKVYAVFDGIVNEDNFIPTGIQLTSEKDGIFCKIFHDNPDAVQAAFWYMDGIFTHILAKHDVDIEKLAERLNPKNKATAKTAFQAILQRLPENLEESVSLLERKSGGVSGRKLEEVGGRHFIASNNPYCPWIEMRPN